MTKLLIASLGTTVFPAAIGMLVVRGDIVTRFALGGLLGVCAFAIGGLAAALVHVPILLGAFGALAGLALVLRHAKVVCEVKRLASPRLVIIAIGIALIAMSSMRPVAAFDGWAIWSLKAKALAAEGDFDGPVFRDKTYEYSHPGYPPLLPVWQAAAYKLSGSLSDARPLQFQLAFLWLIGALALLSLCRAGTHPLSFVIVAWLVAPWVVHESLSGYADAPAAIFLVSGVAFLLHDRKNTLPAALLLAAAALTKIEGAVFVGAALAAFLVFKETRGSAIRLLAMVLVVTIPWYLFAFLNHLPSATGLSPGTSLLRIPRIVEAIFGEAFRIDHWGILFPGCVVLLFIIRSSRSALLPVVAFVATIAIYVSTPYNLDWQLPRSLDRVMIAPAGLLALAVAQMTREKNPLPESHPPVPNHSARA